MYVCMNMNGNVRKHYYHFSLKYRPTTSLTHPLLRRSRVRNLEPAHVEPFHSFLSSDSTQKRISMHSFIHTYNTFAYPVLHNALYNTIYRRLFFSAFFFALDLKGGAGRSKSLRVLSEPKKGRRARGYAAD